MTQADTCAHREVPAHRSRFTGKERDSESGNDYFGARYYNPATARFISEDPLGFDSGSTNLYAYVGDDPINYSDPFGLRALTDCEKRKLAPFIPKIDLDNADLHPGKSPCSLFWMSKDYEA